MIMERIENPVFTLIAGELSDAQSSAPITDLEGVRQ